MLKISHPAQGIFDIKVEGRLDAMVVGEFEDLAEKVLKTKPSGIIFDLEKTTFIDSSGLSAIVKLYKALGKFKTQTVFCQIPQPVMNLFKLTRLVAVFTIYDSLEEAQAAVQPKRK
jgi:anti-sigma B factor antagonist